MAARGHPIIIDLPVREKARICTIKDVYADGREFVEYGIKPDIEVKINLKDYFAKKDMVINKAIVILNKKSKKN